MSDLFKKKGRKLLYLIFIVFCVYAACNKLMDKSRGQLKYLGNVELDA